MTRNTDKERWITEACRPSSRHRPYRCTISIFLSISCNKQFSMRSVQPSAVSRWLLAIYWLHWGKGWCVWEVGVFQHPSLGQYYPARSGKTKLVDLKRSAAGSFQCQESFTSHTQHHIKTKMASCLYVYKANTSTFYKHFPSVLFPLNKNR